MFDYELTCCGFESHCCHSKSAYSNNLIKAVINKVCSLFKNDMFLFAVFIRHSNYFSNSIKRGFPVLFWKIAVPKTLQILQETADIQINSLFMALAKLITTKIICMSLKAVGFCNVYWGEYWRKFIDLSLRIYMEMTMNN